VIFNLLDGELDDGEDRPGYEHRRHSVGGGLLGGTLYETPPAATAGLLKARRRVRLQ
jgi:hypothetical protein